MHRLTEDQGKLLLKIARERIAALLAGVNRFDSAPYQQEKWLFEPGAVFVTLTINGELRGCIGSLEAYRPLFNDLTGNAGNAGFRDPRFAPLTYSEFKQTKIEVSVLTPRQTLEYKDAAELKKKLRPGTDGVYLTHDGYGATFLPQVWDELPDFEDFFHHLCRKAGLSVECIQHGQAKIEIYQVQKFE